MKKLLSVMALLLAVTMVNAQNLDEIVKKFSEANKYDKLAKTQSMKITAKMSMMGMEMPMEMWMKNPDKIKTVMTVQGQQIIQSFDGTKGYMVNPMSGSADPVEMTPEQAKQVSGSNAFKNQMAEYLKDGKLTLDGEENVNEKPAFRIKANIEGGTATMFIDKNSYLLVKQSMNMSTQGQSMTTDTYPSDYKETDGIIYPMKTTISSPMGEMAILIDKIEVNVPMEDSLFKLK